jgi:hypothetical protein
MIRQFLIAVLACLSIATRAQTGGFQPLPIENGKDTNFGQYTLHLAEPDSADKPTMWQGPLTVSTGSASCTADVSLVTAIYVAPARSFVIVLSTSGSNAIANFIELASCASKWPPIKRAASAVTVEGNRVAFSSVCEGGARNAPALCTSARVYLIPNESPPAYLKGASYRLTAKELGVGFTGEARIMDPRTPRAMIVH